VSNTRFRKHFLDERSTKGKEKSNRVNRFEDEADSFDWKEAVYKAKGEMAEVFNEEGVKIENTGNKI